MMLFTLSQHIKYLLHAHYYLGHGVHSPYTYRLFTHVLFEHCPYYSFPKIEAFANKTAGNAEPADRPKYARLLQRLAAFLHAKTLVEIGTTTGISTMYLAANDSHSKVLARPVATADKARLRENFSLLKFANIRLVDSEDQLLAESADADLIYVKCDNLLHWFESMSLSASKSAVFVFANIHSNAQAEADWQRIAAHSSVTLSLDLFRMGIVWFDTDLKKQHYIVKY